MNLNYNFYLLKKLAQILYCKCDSKIRLLSFSICRSDS